MLKFANILTSAGIGKASPFVLSTDDLKQLAQKVLLEKNIQLNTDLNNVKMIITVIDNHIQLFFSIPIEDEDQLFKFFKITPWHTLMTMPLSSPRSMPLTLPFPKKTLNTTQSTPTSSTDALTYPKNAEFLAP